MAGTYNPDGSLNLTAVPSVGKLPGSYAPDGSLYTTLVGGVASIGAAASGANADITSLTGLTTALSQSQGGSGASTLGAGLVTPSGDTAAKAISDLLGYANYGTVKLNIIKRSALVCDIREFSGFDPTFSNANSDVVKAWLLQGNVAKVPCVGPGGSTVAMEKTAQVFSTGDLMVHLPKSFRLKSTTALGSPILDIRDRNLGEHNFCLDWEGGTFDNALGTFIGASQSNTCINLGRMLDSSIRNVRFYGAPDWFTALSTTDSAITAGDCVGLSLCDNFIRGMGDVGYYLGGTFAQDAANVGYGWLVSRNFMQFCNVGVSLKRSGSHMVVEDNFFFDCGTPVSMFEASISTATTSGTRTRVTGNYAKRTYGNFARLHGTTDIDLSDNTIEDFGYQPTGTGSDAAGTLTYQAATNPYAFWLRGCKNIKIDNNTIRMIEWAGLSGGTQGSSNHSAIVNTNYTMTQPDGTTTVPYVAGYLKYSHNTFQNLRFGVQELQTSSPSDVPGPTFGEDNDYININKAMQPLNAVSYYRYFDQTNGFRREFNGLTNGAIVEYARQSSTNEFQTRYRTFLNPIGLTLMNASNQNFTFGTIAAGAYAADQTFTLTGVVAGDDLTIKPNSAAGKPVGLELEAFCVTADTVTVRARNMSASALNMTTAYNYRISVLRFS